MSGVQKIISMLLSDEKLKNSKAFQNNVYQDEPILRAAAQIKARPSVKIKKMHDIAKSYDAFRNSFEWLFYQQGKYMEDFELKELHIPCKTEFCRYYPTYQDMDNAQLSDYFFWRTKVRDGVIEKTCRTYVLIYFYELINQIGVSSKEDGFQKLVSFGNAYQELEPSIRSYFQTWRNDYVVYYQLDKSLLEETVSVSFDNALMTLMHYDTCDIDSLFAAMQQLSAYRIENSRFFKKSPDMVKQVACGIFSELSEYYRKNRKDTYCAHLFGKKNTHVYRMFQGAVFYDRKDANRHEEYLVDELSKYTFQNGYWRFETYGENQGKSKKLGDLLKAVDCMLRDACQFPYPLQKKAIPKYANAIIEKNIELFFKSQKKEEIPIVEIDVSKLGEIREAAALTREKLLVEIEEPEEPLSEAAPAETLAETESNGLLHTTERQFLQLLLNGEPYSALLQKEGILLSVLVDTINEKLFDEFEDTIILFDGDTPELIEDYIDELKGMIES